MWRILEVVAALASKHNATMGQVAIEWLLQRPGVPSVLLGARTVTQLEDDLGVTTVELSSQDMAELTSVSAPGLPPYLYAIVEEYCDVPHWQQLGTA